MHHNVDAADGGIDGRSIAQVAECEIHAKML
jgi:hypothetical protein